MKAILQDFWRKNEENQAEIGRLQQKEVENQGKIERLLQEIDERENHETFIENELEAKSDIIEDLERKNNYALSCPHMVCARCLYPALERERYHQHDIDIQGGSHPSRRCPICRTRVNTRLKKICLQS